MTIQPTTLPDRVAVYAMERARLRALREAIRGRIARDIAIIDELGAHAAQWVNLRLAINGGRA